MSAGVAGTRHRAAPIADEYFKCMGCGMTFKSLKGLHRHAVSPHKRGTVCNTAKYAITIVLRDAQRGGGRAQTTYHDRARPCVAGERAASADFDSDPDDAAGCGSTSEGGPDLGGLLDSDVAGAESDSQRDSESEQPAGILQPMWRKGVYAAIKAIHGGSHAQSFDRLDPPTGVLNKTLNLKRGSDGFLVPAPPRKRPSKITRSAAELYRVIVSANMSQAQGDLLWRSAGHPQFQPADIKDKTLKTFDTLVQKTYCGRLSVTSVNLHQGKSLCT